MILRLFIVILKPFSCCSLFSISLFSGINFFFFFFFFFFSFCLYRAALAAYGGSQGWGLIKAIAAGLRQSQSDARSEPRLQLTPQLTATLDP